jgi:hypothetical protein
MRKRWRPAALAVVAGVLGALVALPGTPAFAHEIRNVGKYQFTVGFGVEPAYLDQKNFIQFFLHDRATGKPITNLGDSLKVAVQFGSQSLDLALEPSFDPDTGLGTPGEYDAFFFPTAPGKYTFHFTGSIDGQKVDESFTSGPTTFSEVEDPGPVQFPVKVPTVGEVGQLVQNQGRRLSAQVSSASDDASSAKTLGLIGIVVGAIGLLTAAGALVVARRRTRSAT